MRAGLVPLKQQRGYGRHAVFRGRAGCAAAKIVQDLRVIFAGDAFYMVSLLRDGEAYHLEPRVGEYLFGARPFRGIIAVGAQHFTDGSYDLFLQPPVGAHGDAQRKRIVRFVDLRYHLLVERGYDGDAALHVAGLNQFLRKFRDEAAKDVAGADVRPARAEFRLFAHLFDIEGWDGDARRAPFFAFFQVFQIKF